VEDFAGRAGDIFLICTGGTPTAAGAPVPTSDISVFLNTAVTSRIYSNGWSEVLLIVDDPGSGIQGTSNTQLACNDPNGICSITGTGTGIGTYDGSSGRPNVFQGRVSGNSVTFQSIPIDAVSTARVLRIVNLRVNAPSLSAGQGSATPVIASISISGAVMPQISNATPTIGYVQSGLIFGVRSPDNSGASGGFSANQCGVGPLRAGVLRFSEAFPTAFQTRTSAAFVDADTSPAPVAQNIPGAIYNTETGFHSPSLTAPTGDYTTIGLASAGTRLRAAVNNIPPGTSVWVSTNRVAFANGVPSVPASGIVARLIQDESTAFAALSPTNVIEGIPAVQLQPVNGSATAVWEILRANPNANEAADFLVWVQPGGTPGTASINGSFGPAPPAFTASDGAAASSTLPLPRFIADGNAFPTTRFFPSPAAHHRIQ
jgi:hypothetical protein